jgi:hypothetical protein
MVLENLQTAWSRGMYEISAYDHGWMEVKALENLIMELRADDATSHVDGFIIICRCQAIRMEFQLGPALSL